MVNELGIEKIVIGDGGVVANTKVKTTNGIMGVAVSFELRKETAIMDAVTKLEEAIEAAMVTNLGLGTPVDETIETEKKPETVS